MHTFFRHSYLVSILLIITSCGNMEVFESEVIYDNETQLILYKDKPFTGKVIGASKYGNSYAIVESGKIIDVIEINKKANGYKEVRHKDNSSEYYDYNGNRISKSEYERNN